jgi:hypothetical protein
LAIPSTLNRKGLTEVINHLLYGSDEDQKNHPQFDFLIDNYILRQPLNKFLRSHGVSNENIIVIEYIPAVTFENESQGNKHRLKALTLVSSMEKGHLCKNILSNNQYLVLQ